MSNIQINAAALRKVISYFGYLLFVKTTLTYRRLLRDTHTALRNSFELDDWVDIDKPQQKKLQDSLETFWSSGSQQDANKFDEAVRQTDESLIRHGLVFTFGTQQLRSTRQRVVNICQNLRKRFDAVRHILERSCDLYFDLEPTTPLNDEYDLEGWVLVPEDYEDILDRRTRFSSLEDIAREFGCVLIRNGGVTCLQIGYNFHANQLSLIFGRCELLKAIASMDAADHVVEQMNELCADSEYEQFGRSSDARKECVSRAMTLCSNERHLSNLIGPPREFEVDLSKIGLGTRQQWGPSRWYDNTIRSGDSINALQRVTAVNFNNCEYMIGSQGQLQIITHFCITCNFYMGYTGYSQGSVLVSFYLFDPQGRPDVRFIAEKEFTLTEECNGDKKRVKSCVFTFEGRGILIDRPMMLRVQFSYSQQNIHLCPPFRVQCHSVPYSDANPTADRMLSLSQNRGFSVDLQSLGLESGQHDGVSFWGRSGDISIRSGNSHGAQVHRTSFWLGPRYLIGESGDWIDQITIHVLYSLGYTKLPKGNVRVVFVLIDPNANESRVVEIAESSFILFDESTNNLDKGRNVVLHTFSYHGDPIHAGVGGLAVGVRFECTQQNIHLFEPFEVSYRALTRV